MKLAELRAKGVALYLAGPDAIRYRGPEAVLTPAYIEEIRRDKAQLIEEMKANCPPCTCPRDWWKCNLALSCPHCRGAVCADCGGCLSDRYRRTVMQPAED